MESRKRFNPYVKVPPEEEIVISGIAGRFPNSDNIKQLQENLLNKVDLGSDESGQWNNAHYDMPKRFGRIRNVEKFDAQYFNMTSSEAHVTDPMCRMLLEHTYEAIVDAGVNPKELQGTKTGVFIGSCYSELANMILYDIPQVAGHPVIGCNKYWLANSISRSFGLNGPSYTVDSACSSSHYAIAEAYRMIRNGECDAAIVGGSNLCEHPNLTFQFFQLGVLCPDGYCKPFDASGAGYMRSEAMAIVYLQKAKDARRSYATLVYVKTNCDGFKEEGITYPSVIMQKTLLEEFYDDCGIIPEKLSYVEAHGTGTIAGDPIEVDAIDQVLCSKRTTPLLMGSVKSNLGHSEPTSGLCQVAKVLIAMETGIIPPHIHYETPRKKLTSIIEGRIKIITEPTSWKGGYVGINSFGFGGANCHVLLKSNPKNKISNTNNKISDSLSRLVVVSGRTEEAVKTILDDVNNRQLDVEYVALLHCVYAENIDGHPYRGYTIAGSKPVNNIISQVGHCSNLRKSICFVFHGTDVTWCNMDLIKLPVFAETIDKCNATLKQYGICVMDILTNKNKISCGNILKSFVAVIATQIGMIDLLTHIGIVPDYMIGHSIGELICGYLDGRFTVEETILTAYHIGVVFEQTKLQVDNITINSSKYLENIKSKLLEHLSRILPQQFSKSRGITWLGRSPSERDNMSATMAEYYIDSVLYPVPLKKKILLIPKKTVLVELMPHSTSQSIVAETLESTQTLVSLCKRGQKDIMQGFLEGIGHLYNIGFQPQIASLYPPVQFPVSRGTPMISPLIKWDHSENYYLFRYKVHGRIYSRIRMVAITTADEEFEYMSGHVIDGKNLLPATGYLWLIWHMIGLLNGFDYCNIPIVFENLNFVRAIHLSKENKVELFLMIQEDSGNFEIIEGGNVIVRGVARVPDDVAKEKLPVQFLPENECNDKECMSTEDIYKELRLRGYHYTGLFRLLKSSSITGRVGRIKWPANWVAFMDNMLHMKILSVDTRTLYVPTYIRKLVIDPRYQMKQIQNLPIEERDLPVRIYDSLEAIVSGGIEICGLQATAIPRRLTSVEVVNEEYCFIAYRDHATMSLKEIVTISVHIALECYEMINVKVLEYIEDDDKILLEDLVTPIVQEVLNKLPLVHPNLTLVAAADRFDSSSLPANLSTIQLNKLAKDDMFLMAIGTGILTKSIRNSTNQLLSTVMPGGFLLSREDLSGTYDHAILQRYDLNIIMEKRTKRETLVLLKKTPSIVEKREIIHINNHEFSWVDKLKSAMDMSAELSTNTRVIVVAEDDPECGILGLVNCLRKEPGGETLRSVFIQDKDAPKFSLQEPFYMNQLQLDLPVNVLRPGKVWGSYRYFLLPLLEQKPVQCGYVLQKMRGDLNTFRWVEGRISPNIKHENLIRVVYASLNFKDVMVATGKLALESLQPVGREVDSILGFEFVGFYETGERIMALCPDRAISNVMMHETITSWVIPEKWTFEEAATVPCVYATCYFALYMKGKMTKEDKVLIHSGTGGIGQAAINLALHEGCEVFTTVGTPEKRRFIRDMFPSIPDDHIGNSRDTSFEQMILQQTYSRGVDIVLNSLAEDKLQASIRCLARGGRFLEIGKYDLISNNALDKMAFARGISFHGIMLDRIFCSDTEKNRDIYNYVSQGLRNGAIKPLPRKVFERTEIETAFRYMAAGKHIGKILIKIRDENELLDLPILAQPRFFCKPHKSYVILGGLGGFGLELADWLILRGARKLLLTSRTGMRNGYQRSRIELWKSYGVNVQIIAGADASDHKDCAFILNSSAEMGSVDAIFNLAVVIKDSLYKNQTAESFEKSFKPKAMVTKMLDQLSRKICPDLRHFVVFSSISCGRGNVGQTNYGMANSTMERICEKRVQDGLPAMAIQWGAIGDVGLVADMQDDNKEIMITGTRQQRIQSCLQTLDAFLMQSRPIVSSMVVAEKRANLGGVMNILDTVANIIGVKEVKTVGQCIPLSELGMDSMMAVEIKQTLERDFDVSLTTQDLRNLTFAKLRDMADKDKRFTKETEPVIDSKGLKLLIRIISNLDIVPDICLEMCTRQEAGRERIFLLPGIEGCGSVFNSLVSKIKAPATCLQHGANNILTSESVMQSAVTLLPHIVTRMKDSTEFIIVGYSYGSLIAVELVRLLETKNLTGRLILIDGSPNYIKDLEEQYFSFTTIQEFQNNILVAILELFFSFDKTMILSELSTFDTWEKKLDVFIKYIPDKAINTASIENYKIYCTNIYKHLVAVHEYDASLLPPLKSPVLLLKPTFSSLSSIEEDYGLSKITEGNVQIHYIEGNHITILENDEVTNAINGDIVIQNNFNR